MSDLASAEHDRSAINEALGDGDWARATALVDALAAELGEGHEQIRYDRAALAWELDGPQAAIELLDSLVCDAPDFADGHYLRAIACEELDDIEGLVVHYLRVLALDAAAFAANHDSEAALTATLDAIEAQAETVLDALPEDFRRPLAEVAIVLEPAPHPDLVREGFDPRALGLFEGLEHGRLAAGDYATAPTRIVLFYANLLADFPDPQALSEEIEVTLLHEIGHYFGLDEHDVERLGLA